MSNRNPRISIGQRVFISTISLVVAALGLTSIVYYFVLSGTSRGLIEDQAKEINKQIVFNYERYIGSVIETANYLQLAVTDRDVEAQAAELQEVFALNAEIQQDVVSIFLFDAGGGRLLGDAVRAGPPGSIRETAWFRTAVSEPEIYHFQVYPSSNAAVPRTDFVLVVSRAVTYLRGGSQQPGVLLVELNTDSITDLSDKTNLGEFGHLLIVDDRGELIYDSVESDYSRASLEIARERYLGGFQDRVNGLDMYIHTNTLYQTRWRIVTVSNIDGVNAAQNRVMVTTAIIGAAALMVTGLVAGLISFRISKPINQLKDIMARIESGDFHTTINVSGQKEIVQLSRSFNQMVVKVRELMDRLVAEQREKRKTELRALQNQINPHFLYNTLDSIVWLAEHNRTRDVVTTVIALARFFRISISGGDTFITVREEIEHIENYLTIQQIRYVEKFEYALEIDPGILEQKVMKLILQPLVENAIYHGTGDETGRITIRGTCSGERTEFEVTNTGYGLTEAKIREMYDIMRGDAERHSVGLRNVFQRLKLYYGDAADIEIESRIDESTTIRLVMPSNGERAARRGS